MKHNAIVCGICGKQFTPYHLVNQDFCSSACRQKAYYTRFVKEHGITPITFRKRQRQAAAEKHPCRTSVSIGGRFFSTGDPAIAKAVAKIFIKHGQSSSPNASRRKLPDPLETVVPPIRSAPLVDPLAALQETGSMMKEVGPEKVECLSTGLADGTARRIEQLAGKLGGAEKLVQIVALLRQRSA